MPSLGLGLGFARGSSFNPSTLFTVGSRGFFYDFSDYSTQFTDTAGATAITGVGQSLGLVLDKSAGLARGPNVAVNGDFSSGTANWSSQLGATLAAISGGMRVTGQAATAFSLAFQTVTASLSTALEITWTATIETAGSTLPSVGIGAAVRQFSASGTYTMIVQGGRANNKVDLNPGTDGVVLFDNISVRELPGNHATQATAGSRPLTTTIGTGFRGIQFDGVDDFLQTAAIDFSNSDKMTVVAGVRRLTDTPTNGIIVEIGDVGTSSVGTASLLAPGANSGSYGGASRGSLAASASSAAASFPAPDTAVLSLLADISADGLTVRRNNSVAASTSADQGTGNFSNVAVFIGRRGGTTLPFNGVLTFLCVINRTLTAGELAALEAYANSRTGAY